MLFYYFYSFYFCVFLFNERASALCSFDAALQGVFITQSTVSRGSDIAYGEITILPNVIPIWGICLRKIGNKYILYDMAGNTQCMRCFHIQSRSSLVIEAHTDALDTCYTKEDMALRRCPEEDRIALGATREIMLYKSSSLLNGSGGTTAVFCPFHGRYTFTYDQNDGTEDAKECPTFRSLFSNCPKANEISLNFNGCSFENFEQKFECLGRWQGRNEVDYLALRDPSLDSLPHNGAIIAPKYRCAMMKEEGDLIYISLSSDSTCFNNLHSPYNGYESLILKKKIIPKHLPPQVRSTSCQFSAWSQGQWESVKVQGSTFTFKDHAQLTNREIFCVSAPTRGGFVPVYVRNHCGDDSFNCLAMQERSSNVMEFRISRIGSSLFKDSLCESPHSLHWPPWTTQGRLDRFKESPCPVAGEYTGIIPDAPMLCAKLSSDCNNPEIMFYTVASCNNKSEIIEEREYRCLGQWTEVGVTYTYTERRDVNDLYECFAGVVTTLDEIFIEEAGTNCKRGLHPTSSGMRLRKQAACISEEPTGIRPDKEPSWWNFSNDIPVGRNDSDLRGTSKSSSVGAFLSLHISGIVPILIVFFIIYRS